MIAEGAEMTAERIEAKSFDGLPIPVWKSGTGRPLLFVHGGTSNHEAWEPIRPHLEDRLTVAIMDRRAHIEDPFKPLVLEEEFKDVVAVGASLGDEVDLFGHSSGALVAMGAALEMPNLRRLILYEPPPPQILDAEPGSEQAIVVRRFDSQLAADDTDGLLETFMQAIVGPMITELGQWQAVKHELRPYTRSIPREGAAIGRCTRLKPEALGGFTAPTLYLTGERSSDAFRGWVDPLRGALADFRVAEIPGQEHLANYHAPALVARLILEFLEPGAPSG